MADAAAKQVVEIRKKNQTDWGGLLKAAEKDHWRKLRLTIKIREKLHAGKPRQLDAAKAMLKARGLDEVVEAMEFEVPDAERAAEVVDEGVCEFHRREGKPGIWFLSNNMKACLKENWSVLGYRKDATPRSKKAAKAEAAVEGEKAAKTVQGSTKMMAEGLFVVSTDPTDRDWIYLGEKADGIDQAVSHTMGPKGPQSSIKRNEFLLSPMLVFEIWIAQVGAAKIPDESLADTLVHAAEHGLGANRSQGLGKFDVISVEEI